MGRAGEADYLTAFSLLTVLVAAGACDASGGYCDNHGPAWVATPPVRADSVRAVSSVVRRGGVD